MQDEPIKPLVNPVKKIEDAKDEIFAIWKDMRSRLVGLQVVSNIDVVASELTVATVTHVHGSTPVNLNVRVERESSAPDTSLRQPGSPPATMVREETTGNAAAEKPARGAVARAKEEKAGA